MREHFLVRIADDTEFEVRLPDITPETFSYQRRGHVVPIPTTFGNSAAAKTHDASRRNRLLARLRLGPAIIHAIAFEIGFDGSAGGFSGLRIDESMAMAHQHPAS